MKRYIAALATAAVALLGLTGCGRDSDVVYRPASFGAPGQCYYVQVPDEAYALVADGLCQPGWAPTLAPSWWTLAYADYLFGPSSYYVAHYVPAGNRVNYASYGNTYVTVHKTEIVAAGKSAKYVGSDGKQTTGEKVAKAAKKSGAGTFGGGTRSGFGGGTRSKPTPSRAGSAPAAGTARSAEQKSSPPKNSKPKTTSKSGRK
jgi:hypothetical protein